MRTRIIGILSTEHTEDTDHRNLDGIYTDFIELLRKKSLEEIFLSIARAQEIYSITREPKSLNKNH